MSLKPSKQIRVQETLKNYDISWDTVLEYIDRFKQYSDPHIEAYQDWDDASDLIFTAWRDETEEERKVRTSEKRAENRRKKEEKAKLQEVNEERERAELTRLKEKYEFECCGEKI